MADIKDIVALMEPAALELGFLDSLGEAATCSIAISLRRIADAIEGTEKTEGMHRILWEIANRNYWS